MSKNCPNGDGGDQRKYVQNDYKSSKPAKIDKMSEDEDY